MPGSFLQQNYYDTGKTKSKYHSNTFVLGSKRIKINCQRPLSGLYSFTLFVNTFVG